MADRGLAVITVSLSEWDELKELRKAIRLERAEVERLEDKVRSHHYLLRAGAYLAELGPSFDDERSAWARKVEALDG